MTEKTKKPVSPVADDSAVKEAVSKAQAWNKDASEKLRELVGKVNSDIRTTSNVAIEGHAQHSARLFQLVGDLLNKRTTATKSLLDASDFQNAIEIEQSHARDVVETLNAGVRELNEIGYAAFKNTSETYSTRAKEAVEGLSKSKEA